MESEMTGIWLASYVILWGVVIALGVLLTMTLRLVGVLHHRLGPTGALIVDEGPRLDASLVAELATSVPALRFPRERDVLMVFLSDRCPSCLNLMDSLIAFSRRNAGSVDVLLLPAGGGLREDGPIATHAAGLRLVPEPSLAKALQIAITPFGVWVDRAGITRGKGIVNHIEHLDSLLDMARQPSGTAGLSMVTS
jgi:methylamine dehydrogenase accessory protein MauD